jgi:Niemann-Pick C1 protein
LLLIHRSGGNVLGQEGVERCFDALETLRSTEGYEQLCKGTGHTDFNSIETCLVYGATNVWNDTRAFFEANVSSDEEAIMSLSSPVFPNGAPVDAGSIFGKVIRGEDGVLESAESFSFVVQLPGQDVKEDLAKEVEERALETLLNLHDMWLNEEGNDFVLQVFAERSFSDEFTRAIVNDIPLVPIVFVIMGVFTCLVFFRRDWVYSRTMLGLGAVVTVLLAIMTGYGIMFMAGVPFTSMTQILPFIMFGMFRLEKRD